MNLTFRSGSNEDLPQIMELIQRAIRHMEEQGIMQWDDLYPMEEDFALDIREGQLFVGMRDETIVVVYTINHQCDEEYKNGRWKEPEKPFAVIHRLCVDPVVQHAGIAWQTMHHIEETAKRRGIQAIRLDVYSKNPAARKLYQKCGYQEVGTAQWRKGKFYLMEKYL